MPSASTSNTSDDGNSKSEEDVQERRIILHVYDDESRDFTSLTTYHGMRRIYSSATWPSRIFWSLVVVTCLTLFMIHSGLMLLFYNAHPTFIKTLDTPMVPKYSPEITICRIGSAQDRNRESHLAQQILKDIPLDEADLRELYDLKNTGADLMELLNYTRTSCTELIHSLHVGQHFVPDPCDHFQEVLTDLGFCLAVTTQDMSADANAAVEIKMNHGFDDEIVYQIHPIGSASLMKSKGWHMRKGLRNIVSVGISTEKLLHRDDWGSCHNEFESIHYENQHYQQSECEKNCIALQYIERCSCVPFYLAKEGGHICSAVQMAMCKEQAQPTTPCECAVDCERLLYKTSPASFSKLKRENMSVLNIEFPSKKVLLHFQLKRIKAVDLLSYVAGSMGLFLGMSCVTLLEIFIYLFKSVWGVFNDERHKSYWGDIIGDEELDRRKQSYEQIVITTKGTAPQKAEGNELPPVIEENYAVMTDPHTRRTSVIRMGPRPSIIPEGGNRSRTNTANSSETATALKIRLMRRPSVVRRKSIYSSFGNF